jgi:hypothetical protein
MAQILFSPQVAGKKCTEKYECIKQWKETAHAIYVNVKIAKEPQKAVDVTPSSFFTQ